MATWIAVNTVRLTYGGQAILIREGDQVSDAAYDLAKLRAAGLQLMPSSDASAAAFQAQAAAQLLRGNADDARRDQPTWGAYVRKSQVTVSGTNASGVWTFSEAEPDASYTVLHAVTGTTTANVALCSIKAVTKATSGVTLTLNASPGASNDITFDVILVR